MGADWADHRPRGLLLRYGIPTLHSRQAERAFLSRQAAALKPEFSGDLQKLSEAPRYQIAAEIDPDAGLVEGQAQVTFTNPGPEPLNDLVFRLYPNAKTLYGGGSLQVKHAAQADQLLSSQVEEEGTTLRVSLPEPLASDNQITVHLSFSAQVPDYPAQGYGIFSRSDQVLALAGRYPVLAPFDGDWLSLPVPEVGDSDFYALLRRFQSEYRYRQADTSAYMDLAEEVSGQDLSQLYQRYFTSADP